MTVCPIAIAVGCKKCPAFGICPLKTVIGDYKPEPDPAPKAAPPSKSASAKATTSSRPTDIQSGIRDCVEAVAEDVTARQVVPFLKRVALAN